MKTVSVAGLAGGVALLLLTQSAAPAGAQEERTSIVPYAAQVSPEAPPMPAPEGAAIVTGNFAGDASDEVLYYTPDYTPGTQAEVLLSFSNEGTGGSPLTWQVFRQPSVSGFYQPLVGDFDGDGHDDILWYGYGSDPDFLWEYTSFTAVTSTRIQVSGNYNGVVGDFTDDGADDIFWYGYGSDPDYVWEHDVGGVRNSQSQKVNGFFNPVVGSFADDSSEDIFWYGYGSDPDYLWDFAVRTSPGVAHVSRSMPVNGLYYSVLSLDEWNDGAGGDDIVWGYEGLDPVWDFQGGVLRRWVDGYDPNEPGWPTAGDFLGDGHEDILWSNWDEVVLWDHGPDANSAAQLARWTYRIPAQ